MVAKPSVIFGDNMEDSITATCSAIFRSNREVDVFVLQTTSHQKKFRFPPTQPGDRLTASSLNCHRGRLDEIHLRPHEDGVDSCP
jgi:hypothetical protein